MARFILGGQLTPRFSWGTRVSAKITQESPLGTTSVSPGFCQNTTTSNCSFSDLNNGQNTIPANLDYAFIGYSSPGGITAQLGRYSVGAYGKYAFGPVPELFAGQQISGFNLGYHDPGGRVSGQFYYGIPNVSSYALAASNAFTPPNNVCSQNVVGMNVGAVQQQFAAVNPNCNTTQSEIGAWALYYFPYSRTGVGGSYDSWFGKQFTFYNSSAVNCTYAGVAREAASPALCAANGGTQVAGAARTGNYVTAQGNPTSRRSVPGAVPRPVRSPDLRFPMTFQPSPRERPVHGRCVERCQQLHGELHVRQQGQRVQTGPTTRSAGAAAARTRTSSSSCSATSV